MSNLVFSSANTAYTEAMRLDASGNLSIGGAGKQGTITLDDGVQTATLTIAAVKGLQEVKDFLDYSEKCGSEVGELWRAYKVANKLDTP
jgi:hypothetical protein